MQIHSIALPDVYLTFPSVSAIIALIMAVFLLVCSAFASGSEIAFFSLTRTQLDELEESKSSNDKRILGLLENPEKLLATILIVNDFVNVGIVMLLNFFFMNVLHFGDGAEWLEFLLLTVVLTFLLLLFGGGALRPPMTSLINGSGNFKLNLAVALLDGVFMRIGLSLILGLAVGMGVYGFWYGHAIAGFTPFFIGGAYFLSGKWRTRKHIINK